jgi:hypothetical protein
MATARLTHDQREGLVLADLQASFPNFAGSDVCHWTKVPDGADPSDFLSAGQTRRIGLELIEWLDRSQMEPAKGGEAQRTHLRQVLLSAEPAKDPVNFRCAVLMPNWGVRLRSSEEANSEPNSLRASRP